MVRRTWSQCKKYYYLETHSRTYKCFLEKSYLDLSKEQKEKKKKKKRISVSQDRSEYIICPS